MSKTYTPKKNPRFVWNIGAVAEQYPDMAEVEGTVLWDRQEKKPVLTFHPEYAQAFCLESTRPNDCPFSLAAWWFNHASGTALESEGIPATK
jgi:hypothetical protein